MQRGEKLTALLIALPAPRVSSGRTPARTAAPVQGRGESPRVPWGALPGGMLTRPWGRLSTPRVSSEGGQCSVLSLLVPVRLETCPLRCPWGLAASHTPRS